MGIKDKIKRLFIASLAIASILILTIYLGGTKAQKPQDMRLRDGVYEGRSFKFPGQMVISLTVQGEKISDIKILKHPAPKRYTQILDSLIASIIESQSTDVDSVTGATISSNALKRAVDDAVTKAGDLRSN